MNTLIIWRTNLHYKEPFEHWKGFMDATGFSWNHQYPFLRCSMLQYYSRVRQWWVSYLIGLLFFLNGLLFFLNGLMFFLNGLMFFLNGLLSFLNGLLLRERLRLESEYSVSLCLSPIRVWLLKTDMHISKHSAHNRQQESQMRSPVFGEMLWAGLHSRTTIYFRPHTMTYKKRICQRSAIVAMRELLDILVQEGKYPEKTHCKPWKTMDS